MPDERRLQLMADGGEEVRFGVARRLGAAPALGDMAVMLGNVAHLPGAVGRAFLVRPERRHKFAVARPAHQQRADEDAGKHGGDGEIGRGRRNDDGDDEERPGDGARNAARQPEAARPHGQRVVVILARRLFGSVILSWIAFHGPPAARPSREHPETVRTCFRFA